MQFTATKQMLTHSQHHWLHNSNSKDPLVIQLNDSDLEGVRKQYGNKWRNNAMLALKLALLDNPTDAILGLADVNGDGKITAVDAMRILQYATGEITQFK